jgi:hypothetical protein
MDYSYFEYKDAVLARSAQAISIADKEIGCSRTLRVSTANNP